MKQNTLTSFIAASSLPIVFLPLFGLAVGARRSGADLDFSMVAIFLPLIFGTFNSITYATGFTRTRKTMFLSGAVLGLMLASLGVFILHIPETVYGLVGHQRYIMLIAGPIFYGSIWSFALHTLEQKIYK